MLTIKSQTSHKHTKTSAQLPFRKAFHCMMRYFLYDNKKQEIVESITNKRAQTFRRLV